MVLRTRLWHNIRKLSHSHSQPPPHTLSLLVISICCIEQLLLSTDTSLLADADLILCFNSVALRTDKRSENHVHLNRASTSIATSKFAQHILKSSIMISSFSQTPSARYGTAEVRPSDEVTRRSGRNERKDRRMDGRRMEEGWKKDGRRMEIRRSGGMLP